MPTASEVKTKFEEFLEQLTEARNALSAQKEQYAQNIGTYGDALQQHFAELFSVLECERIEQLDDVLESAGADWSASELLAAMDMQTRDNTEKAEKIIQSQGSAEDLYKRLEELHEGIQPLINNSRRLARAMYGDILDNSGHYNKTASILENVEHRLQSDLMFMHRSLDGIKEYNDYARKNGAEEITSKNFDQYQKSLLWHAWSALSQTPDVKMQAIASRCIKSRNPHFVEADLKSYEKALADYASFQDIKAQINPLQDVYNELMDYEALILDDEAMETRLCEKVKQSLARNKEFRRNFAETFGRQGRDIIATHAKQRVLEQISDNIGAQVNAVGKAIDDINDGLKKLRRANSYRNIRVDMEKIEKSIEAGIYEIELYIDQMQDRHTRVQNFSPQRSAQNDDGMYFNYLMLYILLADSASFDAGNHDMSRDLSAQFSDALPDLAALDMENFNLNTISIPGIDIGASIDIGSSLSDLSSSMPSASDYGGGFSSGGYDGGSSFGGGFDGGGGGGF